MADTPVVVTSKNWLLSKTLWGNIIASIALFINNQWGFQLSADSIVFIMGILNIILRKFTKEPVTW
jgi:hypothetical protein